jgi:hypothetical protein
MEEMLKLAARARVMDELMADGVNVASPVGACDIDLLALVESRTAPCGLVFVPIQIVVVLHADELSRNLEGARASGVLIALVWDIGKSAPIRSFALTSAELALVKMIDLTDGADAERAHTRTDPLAARESVLQTAIEPFAMSPGKWCKKLKAIIARKQETKSGELLGY